MARAPILIPVATSLAAFVLVLLALFSGMGQPVLIEDLSIITFNTSSLGKNLLDEFSSSSSTTTKRFCRGRACATATATSTAGATSALNSIGNHVADELASALGVKQFYSLHAMNTCEGYFAPNATSSGASRNVTSCTSPFAGYNVTATFDEELSEGPLKLTLSELGFSSGMQQQFDMLYRLVEAFSIIFIAGIGFVGLSLLASIASLVLIPGHEGPALRANLVLSALAMTILIIAAAGLTGTAYVSASKINDQGDDVGIYASAGRIFTAIIWTATGLMILTSAFWAARHRRSKKGQGVSARRFSKQVQDSEASCSPSLPATDASIETRETGRRGRTRQPAAVRDRWGRFHEGSSWNSFPSRISFLSGRRGGGRG